MYLGQVEKSTARYVAGYVTKKMTHRLDPRLNGRHPEFARMSLKPGIGADAMYDVASAAMYVKELDNKDISTIDYGKSKVPLGRYLTRKLRKYRGMDENAPLEVTEAIKKELLPLRLAARSSEALPSLRAQYEKANKGKLAAFEAKSKIHRKERKL